MNCLFPHLSEREEKSLKVLVHVITDPGYVKESESVRNIVSTNRRQTFFQNR